ncbi:MAG: hypothetical protein A3G35_01570 [candidate division NC10 bacterium RIFCSPLOWO2_12_FULL_66_18]|nr:MAG: hypothetical protein A3H39_02875 [candidate division NC10 bacterium RIFCSPLOWO2_02_FULL_66_22]OGC01341.1 MAG: hypothetical protein A3G35_01570 [candidate division NC10 bacterium RIFCSPLOWO2_12_FULL_66_18]
MEPSSEHHPSTLNVPGLNGNRWDGLLEVFQAFHRWQQAPADHLKQEFFRQPARGLCSLHRDYPPHRLYLLQRALIACLPGWRQVLAAGFGSHTPGEAPLKHVLVPSGPGRWDVAVLGCHLGFEDGKRERLMARIDLENESPAGSVACLTLIAPTEKASFLRDLLDRLEAWMDANPHLRGAKLDARGDLLMLDHAYTWDDIVLDPATRAEIARHIIQFLERIPRYRTFGLSLKRGVLLAGPPGTGKTLLGKVLCSTLSTTFIWVSPGEVSDAPQVQRLFVLARELQPTILFLEDLDLYAGHRGNGGGALLGELLNQLDGFPNNAGILTLATTNDPRAIEPALAQRPSRFDRLIRLDPPRLSERQQLLARFLRNIIHPEDELPEIAAATDGLAGAHLQEVVHLAVQAALDEQPLNYAEPPKLRAGQLREAVRLVRKQLPGPAGFYA